MATKSFFTRLGIVLVIFLGIFSCFVQESVLAAENPGMQIAILDMQKAIQSVSEGKKARTQLQKEWEAKQKKLADETKSIQTAMEDLRKQSMVLDEKARREKEEGIQQRILKLRELEMQSQMEFQKRDQEVSGPIIHKIRQVVSSISKSKGYNLVLDGNENKVIFAQNVDDITDEVIKQYDNGSKSSGKK